MRIIKKWILKNSLYYLSTLSYIKISLKTFVLVFPASLSLICLYINLMKFSTRECSHHCKFPFDKGNQWEALFPSYRRKYHYNSPFTRGTNGMHFPLLNIEEDLSDACMWSHGRFFILTAPDACMWPHGQSW